MFRLFLLSLCLIIATSSRGIDGQELQTAPRAAGPDRRAPLIDSLQKLGQVVAQYVSDHKAVGAELLVVHQDEAIYHESFGFSDQEDQRRWENDTLCNIRSMTKPITAAAAQILIDRKRLKLDDPVANYLESFDNDKSRSITVRQVLTHRSGLPTTNLVGPYQYSSLDAQVSAAGGKGPEFEPGSKFWYSDTGADVVGALVEEVSGEPLHAFVKREIIDPLNMTSTLYGIDDSDKRLSLAASLYLKVGNAWMPFWRPGGQPLYPFAWGSQSVYSTTTDYAKFLKMMMNGGRVGDRQLLSRAAVSRMLEPVSRAKMMGSDAEAPTGFRSLEVYYGQMMVTYRDVGNKQGRPVIIGHSGSDGTCAWGWPARDLVILYFTQSRGGLTPLRIEESIDQLIVHPGEDLVEEAPQQLRPYLGKFIANYGSFDNETFTVKAKNGKLVLDVPSQLPFELLEPDDRGYWAFAIRPDQVQVEFDRNEEHEVVGLRLHKAGKVYEVPRVGTARAHELAEDQNNGNRESHTTTWKGVLNALGTKLRLEVDIVVKSGQLTGEVRSLDQGNAKLRATDINVDGDTFAFSVQKIGAKFSGKYSENRGVVKGTFSQNGVDLPLRLAKSGETTAELPEEPEGILKEAWIGELEMGLIRPVMQFRIVTLESGETAAYFDSVTEGRTDFAATWSLDGDQLQFDVATIRLKYRGTLNESGDTAEGTWSQGGRDVPLTLKKQAKAYEE